MPGLPPSNADKRKAVLNLLSDAEWRQWCLELTSTHLDRHEWIERGLSLAQRDQAVEEIVADG